MERAVLRFVPFLWLFKSCFFLEYPRRQKNTAASFNCKVHYKRLLKSEQISLQVRNADCLSQLLPINNSLSACKHRPVSPNFSLNHKRGTWALGFSMPSQSYHNKNQLSQISGTSQNWHFRGMGWGGGNSLRQRWISWPSNTFLSLSLEASHIQITDSSSSGRHLFSVPICNFFSLFLL